MADGEDKTEAPTQRRREEARRDGQVARSNDLVAATVLLASLLLMQITGPRLIRAWMEMVRGALASPMTDFTLEPLATLARALAPLLIGLIVVAFLINLVQTGFLLRLKLHFDVLDPSRGFTRIFSKRSAAALAMNVLKIVAVGWIAWSAAGKWIERIVSLQQLSLADGISAGAAAVFAVGIRIAFVLLVLAMIDYGYQRWRHERELRMTRREVKDELRLMEGDESIKRRRRELAAAARKVG